MKENFQDTLRTQIEIKKPIQIKPNILENVRLEQAFRLAKKRSKKGKIKDSKQIYEDILSRFPKNRKAQHYLDSLFKKLKHDTVNYLIDLYNQGQFLETIKYAQLILEKYPEAFIVWNILGAANKGLHRISDAVVAFKRVTELNPTYAIGHNNLGIVLQEAGKLEKAIEAYNNAINIKHDYFEAYYNMGNALKDQDKLEEAIEAYNKTILLKPDYVDVYYNKGRVLQEQRKLKLAIESYNKALSIKPNYAEAYNNMGIALTETIFKKPNRGLQKTIVSLLNKKLYVRPKDIAVAAISLLKFEPTLQKHLQLADAGVIESPLDIISELDEIPLLRKLMSVCPIPDLELEKLFKQLRASILENIVSLKETSDELLRFQSALALQCFTNEYVYSQSQNEEKAINVLEKKIKKLLSNNEQPGPLAILILASYKALHKYDWCQSLKVTNQIQDVYTRQVEEPNQEEKLKLNLPILGEISNKVSLNVREQYEESPYPRWVNTGLRLEPAPISKIVEESKLKLHCEKINETKNPNILIAGCGTGQHLIETASRFKSSKVLAIDLSLSSLAYAKRKTEELLSDHTIEYMQADILDLDKLGRRFDIIESAGVLHHIDNPMKGWKALTDCLKQGGMMRIGLYSELSRQNIVKIREEISQRGIGLSDAEMRSFRDMIIESDKNRHKLITQFPDFYSLSELRDLLFHVQEHRFTIPLIKYHLNKLGLKFCGFESSKIVSHFKLTNKDKEDPYDLDKWEVYEEANPIAFAGMYQFWCQKDL